MSKHNSSAKKSGRSHSTQFNNYKRDTNPSAKKHSFTTHTLNTDPAEIIRLSSDDSPALN